MVVGRLIWSFVKWLIIPFIGVIECVSIANYLSGHVDFQGITAIEVLSSIFNFFALIAGICGVLLFIHQIRVWIKIMRS